MPGRWLTSTIQQRCTPKRILIAYNIPLQLPTVPWGATGHRARVVKGDLAGCRISAARYSGPLRFIPNAGTPLYSRTAGKGDLSEDSSSDLNRN
jgi:hypothetical protein